MVEFMQPLKNTCLKEIQWRKKMLTKYQLWARGLGQETLYALVPFWKNTPISQVCAKYMKVSLVIISRGWKHDFYFLGTF